MMDLELMRWKHVGLFYKQLKSSPQTVFLKSVFSIRTVGFLGFLAVLGEITEKATNTAEGLRTVARPISLNKAVLGRRCCDHALWMKKQRLGEVQNPAFPVTRRESCAVMSGAASRALALADGAARAQHGTFGVYAFYVFVGSSLLL